MRGRLPTASLITALLLAGCAGPEAPPPVASVPVASGKIFAPELAVGDWWRIHVKDITGGIEYDLTRAVAAANDTTYLIGMPAEEFANRSLLVPAPGFGSIPRSDLSWTYLDTPFQALSFPLEDGKTWTTELQGFKLDANASVIGPGLVHVELHGPASDITLLYDAHARAIVKFVSDNWVEFEVLEQGTGYTGTVVVPEDLEHAVYGGRVHGIIGFSPSSMPTTETFAVDDWATTLSLMLVAGPTSPPAGLPQLTGVFRERAMAPDGTTIELTTLPGESLKVQYHAIEQPAGTWRFEHVAGGVGAAFASGVSYRSTTIDLG